MSAKPGRNEPCPCGSGKKFKNCCESGGGGLGRGRLNQLLLAVLLLVGLAAVTTAYVSVSGENVSEQENQTSYISGQPEAIDSAAVVPTLTPPPPGPIPEGKVWSAEHGHWHDAPNQSSSPTTPISVSSGQLTPVESPFGAQPSSSANEKYPHPPGPAPEGKVWSYEHGHWHNSQEAKADQGQLVPQPPGDPPPGKTWSAEHGHWHGPPSAEELSKNEEFMKRAKQRDDAIKAQATSKGQNPEIYQQQLSNETLALPPATEEAKSSDGASKTTEGTTAPEEEKKP